MEVQLYMWDRGYSLLCALLGPPGCAQVFPYLSPGPLDSLVVCKITRGGQRYFFGGCAFARMLTFFLRPLALDRNDFKSASALSAIPL